MDSTSQLEPQAPQAPNIDYYPIPPSPQDDEAQNLLQQWQPRKQPTAATTAAASSPQPNGTSARQQEQQQARSSASTALPDRSTPVGSAIIDLISDDEKPSSSRQTKPMKPKFKARHPPSSVAPGQTEPYILAPNATRCPFLHCSGSQKTYSAEKLRKHMVKRHGWPESILQHGHSGATHTMVNGRPKSSSGAPVVHGEAPLTNGDHADDCKYGAQSVNGAIPVQPKATPKTVGEASTATTQSDSHLNGEQSTPSIKPSAERQDGTEEELSDIPVVPGQLEPYTLPSGILNCPIPRCNKHNFQFDASSRVTEHMKRYHGWPRPTTIEQEWERAKDKTTFPPHVEAQSSEERQQSNTNDPAHLQDNQLPLVNHRQSRKRSIDGTLKPQSAPNTLKQGPTAPAVPIEQPSSTIVAETPPVSHAPSEQRKAGGVSAKLLRMAPSYAKLQQKTQDLWDAIGDNARAAGKGRQWTPQEEALIFHLRDDIGVKWTDLEPFFLYRGSWHLAQSRYSAIKRQRKATQGSLHQSVDNDESVNANIAHDITNDQQYIPPDSPVVSEDAEDADTSFNRATFGTTRRSARSKLQIVDYSKYFHLRPPGDETGYPEVPPELETKAYEQEPNVVTKTQSASVEIIPKLAPELPQGRRQIETTRNDAAIGGLSPRLARFTSLQSESRRQAVKVQKPYLSVNDRRFLRETMDDDIWDADLTRRWEGQELHVDFIESEANSLKRAIMRTSDSFNTWQANRLGLDLKAASAADVDVLAQAATRSDRHLNRTKDSVRSFLSDIATSEARMKPNVHRLRVHPADRAPCAGRNLRECELYGFTRDRGSVSVQRSDAHSLLGPQRIFKGTSSDVNNVAWSPDGHFFAVGSAALTDQNSMQYNRPNNLLFGDFESSRLLELPSHAVPREASSGPNATREMQASQDPLLFTTISDVQFSSDSKVLFTAGYDKSVRLWEVSRFNRDDDESTSNGLRFRWCLSRTSEIDAINIAQCVPNAPRLFAAATKTSGNKPPVRIYSYSLDDADTIDDCDEPNKLGKDRRDLGPTANLGTLHGHGPLDTSCLRFNNTPGCHNKYLLGGFTARDDSERRGETCLWDVDTATLISSFNKRTVFDIKWSPSIFGRFAVGCSAINANRGTQTVVRLHDSRWLPSGKEMKVNAQPTIELECPALDMNDVLFNPRDPHLMSAGCTDGVAYVWDLRNPSQILHRLGHGDPLNELDHTRTREEADTGIRFLSWDLDGRRLLSGSSDGVVACWDPYMAPQNAFKHEVVRMSSGIMAGAFSPDYANLLLGDVEGSVLTLGVGNNDVSLSDCEPFEFLADERTKARMRARADFVTDDIPTEEESGKQIGSELVCNGQIILKPYGDFPRKQAVQGPNYLGPFDKAPDANGLRRSAAAFQKKAQATISSSSTRATPAPFTDEDVADAKHWEERIPSQLHGPPFQKYMQYLAHTDTNTSGCSKCTGRDVILRFAEDFVRGIAGTPSDDEFACRRCGAHWRADVLGYEILYGGWIDARTLGYSRDRHKAGAASGSETRLEPVQALEHLHDLWEIDQLARRPPSR